MIKIWMKKRLDKTVLDKEIKGRILILKEDFDLGRNVNNMFLLSTYKSKIMLCNWIGFH